MFFVLVVIAIGIYFYLKSHKKVEQETAQPEIMEEEKELTIDEKIELWSQKNQTVKELAQKEIKDVKPSISQNSIHFLAVCNTCLSVFSIDESEGICPCCETEDLVYSDKGKLYSAKWSDITNSWALTKESAYPIMVLNRAKR